MKTVPVSNFVIPADMVVKALGQEPLLDLVAALPDLTSDAGRIVVDPSTGATSVPGLFAGGDCLRTGGEIVDAVEDGKIAATRDTCASLQGQKSRRRPTKQECHMTDLSIEFCGVKAPNPVLVGLRPANQFRIPGSSRLRSRMGRRRLEDARRRADRQCLVALWRHRLRRPESDGAQ